MKEEKIKEALCRALEDDSGGIGRLSEKYIHRTLKYYLEPDESKHEVEYLGSVADIRNEEGITEIQTRAFEYLAPKLKKILKEDKVTLVCPIIKTKYITTLTEDGEVLSRKKSPMQKGLSDVAIELYKIKEFILDKNLEIRLIFLAAEADRTLIFNTSRPKYKKGRVYPYEILEEKVLKDIEDFRIFLPAALPDKFLRSEYNKAIKARAKFSYYALKLCEHLGFVKQVGKRGNAFIYEKCK
ncbi:MAG: hypothetical protein IKV20_00230 [Clostridia bacterium]|nr:hypothetical protein [Clostridia bacterium]